MHFKKEYLQLLFLSTIVLILNLIFIPIYKGGDQSHYIKFYYSIENYNFFTGYLHYFHSLGAQEPIYYFIVFVFSKFFSKDIFVLVLNLIFSISFFKLVMKKLGFYLTFSFIFNFYFLVLLFSAERLKVSILLFLIAVLLNHKRLKILFFLGAILSHFQTSILVISLALHNSALEVLRLFYFKLSRKIFKIFFITLLSLPVFYLMLYYFTSKLNYYLQFSSIYNIVKPISFLLLCVFINPKKKLNLTLSFLPIIFFSYVIGEERLVIFCYFLFLFAVLQNPSLKARILLFVLNLYFIFKGINFLNQIILYGDGFYL